MSGDSLEIPSDSQMNMEDYNLLQAVYRKPNVHHRLLKHAKSPKNLYLTSPLAGSASHQAPKTSTKPSRPMSSKPYTTESFGFGA